MPQQHSKEASNESHTDPNTFAPELNAQIHSSSTDQVSVGETELSAVGTQIPRQWRSIVTAVWCGQAVSAIMSGAAGYALIWYLTVTTESPLVMTFATAMYFIPMALFGPLAGALADRHSRKAIMIGSDLGIGASMLIMAVVILMGATSVPLVLVMICLRSIGVAFHQPAMLAVMPLLVPDRHLVRINTLDQGIQAMSNIVAPAIGILLYTTVGLSVALIADVVGVLVACLILALVTIPAAQMSKEQRTTIMKELLDGLQTVRSVRGLTALFVLFAIGVAAFMPLASLYSLMTYSHFGGSGFDAALVEAFFGIGFLAGSIILGIWGGGKRLMRVVMISLVLQGITFVAIGFLPPSLFIAFIVLSCVSALFGAFFNGPLNTIVQRRIAPEKLARVMSLMTTIMSLAAPVGLIVAGPIAETVGVTPWFVFGGLALIVLSALALLMPSVRMLDKHAD